MVHPVGLFCIKLMHGLKRTDKHYDLFGCFRSLKLLNPTTLPTCCTCSFLIVALRRAVEAGEEDTFTTGPGLQQLGNSEDQTCHTATADRSQEYAFEIGTKD